MPFVSDFKWGSLGPREKRDNWWLNGKATFYSMDGTRKVVQRCGGMLPYSKPRVKRLKFSQEEKRRWVYLCLYNRLNNNKVISKFDDFTKEGLRLGCNGNYVCFEYKAIEVKRVCNYFNKNITGLRTIKFEYPKNKDYNFKIYIGYFPFGLMHSKRDAERGFIDTINKALLLEDQEKF